jgi:hypothetical protein
MTDGRALTQGLVIGATMLLCGYALLLLVARLRSSRPGLAIAVPTVVAFLVRAVAAAGVSLTGIASGLRGGDEVGFFDQARTIATTAVGSGEWLDALTGHLHVFVFAVQVAVFDSPAFALRVAQGGIAVAGLVLLAVAVYEMAGGRAATIAMWVLALEPTDVFFSTLLHKEANMTLAAGLIAFGGALIWKRGRAAALAPIAAGCLIAVATRPYVGWFLIGAGAAIVLHAGLRQRREGGLRSLSLIAVVVLLAAIAAPTVLEASSDESLERLQGSQSSNAANQKANLSLEQVDFSTRGAIVAHLPSRALEVLTQPYPWQLQNVSQQVGLVGTAAAYLTLVLLLAELVRSWGSIMARAGPLVYVGAFMLVAYSLAAGNAGTAFRYRAHLLTVAVCLIVTLWQLRVRESGGTRFASAPDRGGGSPRIEGGPRSTQGVAWTASADG